LAKRLWISTTAALANNSLLLVICKTKLINNINPTIPVVANKNKIDESEPEHECDSMFTSFRYNRLAGHKLLNPTPIKGDFLIISRV